MLTRIAGRSPLPGMGLLKSQRSLSVRSRRRASSQGGVPSSPQAPETRSSAKRMVSSPYGFFFAKGSSGKDEIQEPAPNGRADDLPEPVAEAVLEALGGSYQAVWGVKPAVTSQQPAGKQQVIAYIERPFDTNIVCLHSYLGTAFSARVPRESRDPYRLFMDALELKPPPSLRHTYLQNPYAVTLWLLLRRAGFEDINIIRRFLQGQSFGRKR